jgi:putative membrane protein
VGEPQFRRLHPGTIGIEIVRVLGRFVWFVVILVILSLSGQRGDSGEFFFEAAGAIVVVVALVRYWTTRYAVHDQKLIVRSGLLVKNERTIPLDRIQNINFSRNLLHRVLGLVDVQIETASGAGAEANLSALGEAEAQRLRAELTGAQPEFSSTEPVWQRQDSLYRAGFKELLLAGATGNRALFILASVVGFAVLLPSVVGQLRGRVVSQLDALPGPVWMAFAGAGAALFFVGWIVSIVTTIIGYWDFEVRLRDGRLQRTYGLLNHVENFVPIRRVQVLLVSQNVLQRLLRVCTARIETAGAYAASDGNERGPQTSSPVLSPMTDWDGAQAVIREVVAGSAPGSEAWTPISPKTVVRGVRSALLWAVLASAGGWFWLGPRGLAFGVGLLVLAWLAGLLRKATCAFSDSSEVFVSRRGAFSRHTSYVPVAKVQSVALAQSPVQRRLALADLRLTTAGSSLTGVHIEVPDLAFDVASGLADSLHGRSLEAAWANPDGF